MKFVLASLMLVNLGLGMTMGLHSQNTQSNVEGVLLNAVQSSGSKEVDPFTSNEILADLRGYGCITVYHRLNESSQNVRVKGKNGTTYKVEYRTVSRTLPRTFGSWTTAATETLVTPCDGSQNFSPQEATVWRYRTLGFWLSEVGSVQWRVTTTEHPGIICGTMSSGATSIIPDNGGTSNVSIQFSNVTRDSGCVQANSPFTSSITVLYAAD